MKSKLKSVILSVAKNPAESTGYFAALRMTAMSACFVLLIAGHSFAQSPSRIVSLKPNITDIIYAIGEGDRLVGVTKYCDIPDGRAKPPVVADYTQPFTERIISLSPDVVLGSMENSSRRSIESLDKLGIKVRLFPFATIEETKSSTLAIADQLGVRKKGEDVEKKFDGELTKIKTRWRDYPVKRVMVVWGTRPVIVAGPGGYMDELLSVISAENVVKDTKIKYPRIGIEEMIALDPDVIIDLSMGNESGKENGGRPWDGVGAIRAVQNGSVITMDAAKFRAGPNLPAALGELASKLRLLTVDHGP